MTVSDIDASISPERKTIRDGGKSIITHAAMQKLSKKAGISEVKKSSYGILDEIAYERFNEIARLAKIYMRASQRKTLSEEDVRQAIKSKGIDPLLCQTTQIKRSVKDDEGKTVTTVSRRLLPVMKTGHTAKSRVRSGEDATSGATTTGTTTAGGTVRKTRRGIESYRRIRHYQRQGRVLTAPKKPFKEALAYLTKNPEGGDKIRISNQAATLAQFDTETFLHKILRGSSLIATRAAKRVGVKKLDIVIAYQLITGRKIDFEDESM
jgi:histone H3/H4